jgi:D-inositol-3-phosphate glycosyltransferase
MRPDLSVAVIELVGGHGGMNLYDTGLCRGLLAAGANVSLYTCDETTDPKIPGLYFCPAYKRIYGKSNRLLRALRLILGSFSAVRSATKRHEKIVHFHIFQSGPSELFIILLAKLWRRKVVITVHDVESLATTTSRGATLIKIVHRLADHIIVHNGTSKNELLKFIKWKHPKVSVIPHGNYLASILNIPSANDAKHSLDINETKKVILFFGQIKDAKGLDLLIKAMPEVIRNIPEAMLVIAGRPWKTDFSKYDALIEKLDLRNTCRLTIGYVADDKVAQYYTAADVVVLPYRRIYQSGVLLLAMSYGKAVVASDIPAMVEIVSDGDNGYLFARESSEALARTLVSLLGNDHERTKVGSRARDYVQFHHDWSQIGIMTAELYRALLSRPQDTIS